MNSVKHTNPVLKMGRCRRRVGFAAARAAFAVVCAAVPLSAWAAGQASDPNSPDRSMAFVEKSVEATDLFNQRKLDEALRAFEALLRDYRDLDQDGYVGISLGDCLRALGRNDEARSTYEAMAAAHPDMAPMIRHRLWEMELTGPVSDELLAELRATAATEAENPYYVKAQFARALQKRALDALSEAGVVMQDAAQTNLQQAEPTRRLIVGQAEMLAELKEDLLSLIDRFERGWAGMKTLQEMIEQAEAPGRVQDCRSEWTSTLGNPQVVTLETRGQGCESVKATVGGRAVPLNPTQALIIRRHQERIDAILMEAAQAGNGNAAAAGQ